MYELAKKSREALKSKARSLASEKDQKVDSSDWSPAEPLNTEVKTGARPVSRRAYKDGGKVVGDKAPKRLDRKPRASGGMTSDDFINRNVKSANEKRPGGNAHVGGFKKGGEVPSDAETKTTKDRIGTEKIKPVRGAAEHYKKGGRINKQDAGGVTGGKLPEPDEAIGSEVRLKGLKVMPSRENTSAAQTTPDTGDLVKSMRRLKEVRKHGGKIAKKRGGEVAGRTTIVIAAGPRQPERPAMGGAPMMPPPPAQMAAPMPPAPPPVPAAPPPAQMPLARKDGGRITKKASSYKDMEAGAASGEGRLQKTEIAAKHKDAPAKKYGGRLSKVAKSYKDMTAGAASGEGRLQKEDIAKAKKVRAA